MSSIVNQPPLSDDELLTQLQHRACRFFWEKADPLTGLVNDRASNAGDDQYTVASIASTGYALASLPIAVQYGWVTHAEASERALLTLRFLHDHLPHTRGWCYHFVDKRTGERVWDCEVSSIDTALLLLGALVCGQYFQKTEVQRLANALYDRVDWQWMLTNGGEQPDKRVLSHGWKPESGFLLHNWDSYCELMLLYLPGMGALHTPLPAQCWDAWERPLIEYKGHKTLLGGPIFIHQMAHGFYDFSDQQDRGGWNYWETSLQATLINRQFCIDRMDSRATYSPTIWGLNACDYPGGYTAFAAPGEEDGTVSPSGAIASILFTPSLAVQAAQDIYTQYGSRIWGKFGFANAFNVDQEWYDKDVIGIDLGMMLVNIENSRTRLIWHLLASHASTPTAWAAAGFRCTVPDIEPL